MKSLRYIKLPCNAIAEFDESSGCSYRCHDCMATVGSIGMPKRCQEEAEKYQIIKVLGGKGWDYSVDKDYQLYE